jgi:hypothetical protein
MSTIRQTSMSVVLAATLFGSASAHAGLATNTMVSTSVAYQTDYGTQAGNSMSSSLHLANATSDATARATANYGVLKSYVSGYGTAYSTSTAVAYAGFTDFITISNPELDGQVGTVTLSFYYDYDLDIHGNNTYPANTANGHFSAYAGMYGYYGNTYSSQVNTSVNNNGVQDFINGGVTTSDLNGLRYDAVGHYLTLTGKFVYGSAFMVNMNIAIDGSTYTNQNGGTSSYVGDASHSGYWGGISSLTADGKTVTAYTLSSQSGTDYSQSFAPSADVPEPGALALIAAGLAGMVGVRRKRAA